MLLPCSELPFPLISCSLLRENEDVIFVDAFELPGRDIIKAGLKNETTPVSALFPKSSVLSTSSIGIPLIMEPETATIKTTRTKSTHGYQSKVSLSYEVIFPQEDPDDINSLMFSLEHSHFSLLLEFFGSTYAIVRTKSNGEGFHFEHTYDKGKEHCTLSITNTQALQILIPSPS